MGYGLDVAVSHNYGGNVAHFFLVMLAYNLMNWFKEEVLDQKKVKRMAKWIRERFFYIPSNSPKSPWGQKSPSKRWAGGSRTQ
ncbi:MAG: hypothetical protein DDT24_00175 [Chloroflexi bacterium]|nr:hypothetical protein [Chloroflexota bacterium]